MLKVYIDKRNTISKIFTIKRYDDDMVIHDYFTSEKEARNFIKELKLNYTIVKKKARNNDIM